MPSTLRSLFNKLACLILKDGWGWGWGAESALQVQIKIYQFFFSERCLISAFTKNLFGKLRMIEIGPRGRCNRSSSFQSSHPSQKNMLPKANEQEKKKTICQIFHQKGFDKN